MVLAHDEVEIVGEPRITIEESEGGSSLEDDSREGFSATQGSEDGFLCCFLEDMVGGVSLDLACFFDGTP